MEVSNFGFQVVAFLGPERLGCTATFRHAPMKAQLLSCPNRHHPVAQCKPALGGRCHRGIMRHHHDRETCGVQLLEKRNDAFARGGIEMPCRLVGQQQGRLVHEGAGNRGALHFTSGKLMRAVGSAVREADPLEQLVHTGRAVSAGEERGQGDVLGDAERGHEAEMLEYETDLLAPQPRALALVQMLDFAA